MARVHGIARGGMLAGSLFPEGTPSDVQEISPIPKR